MSSQVLFNGRPESAAWTSARGLHYGDGIFRTCLIYKRQLVDLKLQLDKIIEDASALNLSPRAARACMREAQILAASQESGVLKILLWRSARQRGYSSSGTSADRLL